MKRIKGFISALLAGIVLSMSSCTNLDEELYSNLTNDNLEGTEQEILSMVGSLYVQFRFLYWAWEGYFDIMEESSDCLMTPYRTYGGWGAQYINLHQNDPYAGIPHLYQEWYYGYNAITKANTLLENPVVQKDEAMVAEVRAMRVLFYYILFDLWRNIPLETEISDDPHYQPVQAAPEDIWDFMVKEIDEILPLLSTEKSYGRMNKYALCMVAAKIYLNHDSWLKGFGLDAGEMVAATERNADSEWFDTNADNDNKWYKKAYDFAEIVCAEGGYQLAPNYKDIAKANLSSCPEVILVIPEDAVKASHNYLVNKCFVGNGGKAYGYNGTPWNGSCAVPQFIHSYDPADKRLTDTWAFGQQYYYGTQDPIYMADQKLLSEGLTEDEASSGIHKTYGHKAGDDPLVYTVEVHSINNPGAFDMEGARFQKQEIVAGTSGTYGNDVCFFRLADAMFIKAEVLLRIGSYDGKTKQDAADLITQVRTRSFDDPAKAARTVADLEGDSVYDYGIRENTSAGKNPYADFKYEDAADLFSVKESSFTERTRDNETTIELGGLLDDLAWEFVGEHHRRQDLIRFTCSNGVNVYNGKTWFCRKNKLSSQTKPTDYKNNVFPIYSEFVKANLKLKQNYGFSDESSVVQPAG